MFSKNLFKAAIIRTGLSSKELAQKIGISERTLYRKMSGDSDFTRIEIIEIRNLLNLSSAELEEIFFAQ